MKVFVISDSHFPFHNKRAFAEVMRLIRKERPNAVVHIGDLLDQYVFSRFDKSSSITPEMDVQRGLDLAERMWSTIHKALPRTGLYQVLGNHDARLSKRLQDKVPELLELYNPLDMYKFPNVKVLDSYRDHMVLDGVVYTHGYLSKSIDHAKHFGKPVVHGHLHRPGISTFGKLWTMDVGHIANENSLPLSYTQSKVTNWRMACGIIEDGHPRLILL